MSHTVVPSCFTQETLPVLSATFVRRHTSFRTVMDLYGPPPFWHRPNTFTTLVKIILEQQVHLHSAASSFVHLTEAAGGIYPEALLPMSDEAFRAARVSRQKAGYLRHLSGQILAGHLVPEQFPSLEDEVIRRQLMQVKGIGPWTASVYLLMVLHRCDVFPPGDVALYRSFREVFPGDARQNNADIQAYSETWAPFRSIGALLLYHAYLSARKRTFEAGG